MPRASQLCSPSCSRQTCEGVVARGGFLGGLVASRAGHLLFPLPSGKGRVQLHDDSGERPCAQDVMEAPQQYADSLSMPLTRALVENNAVAYEVLQYQLARTQRQQHRTTDALSTFYAVTGQVQQDVKQALATTRAQKDRADAENSLLRAKLARVTKERDRIALARDLAQGKLAQMARNFASSENLDTKQLWTSYAISRQRVLALQSENETIESKWKHAQAEAAHQEWRCKAAQEQAAALAGLLVAFMLRAN
ncbi:hypothetical protein WJX72_007030 [[Myrmecia] bisecta]|uniref:Uncharacterized protein n=1 Tax=[Myrmecia] bisecta TaxID=41462 RepID=A0AAW1P9V1_9CHLO